MKTAEFYKKSTDKAKRIYRMFLKMKKMEQFAEYIFNQFHF